MLFIYSLLFSVICNLSDNTSSCALQGLRSINAPANEAPVVAIFRDDHVATIEIDYDPSAWDGGQIWSVGTDGLDHSGYLITWWPDAEEADDIILGLGCSESKSSGRLTSASEQEPFKMVTANRVVQLQPIANDVKYHVKVEKINGLGKICSPATQQSFQGGDGARVEGLRQDMTFFDDFNLAAGLPDELKWNTAMTPQVDPRFNLFFINPQCHGHSMTGTLNGSPGDKSQVAQRPRKSILIEESDPRRIVFDMDGIFSPRSVWYLDLNPVKTDLSGHMSFFDSDGDKGLPADILRLRSARNELSVHLINTKGESFKVANVDLADFGRKLTTNVRRSFEVLVSTEGIEVKVDTTTVISEVFDEGAFKAGVYDILWSVIGYNTSKSDNPYFLSHWDNFGFDGPDVEENIVYNYVTRIKGTDKQKFNANSNASPTFNINVPDDIKPIVEGVKNEVWLVFTYMYNDYSTLSIQEGDHFLFNGQSFPLPAPYNNSDPVDPSLVGAFGSPISNRIKIGEVNQNGTSPLNIGDNTIQFLGHNGGIMNLHLEVVCPKESPLSSYTPPSQIHPYDLHHDLPQLGTPASIIHIDNESYEEIDGVKNGPVISGQVPVEILIGNESWANWAPGSLRFPALGAHLWSNGSTPGFSKVDLYIRPFGLDSIEKVSIATLNTNEDAPSPQLRYEFMVDTEEIADGMYELSVEAIQSDGRKSHPAYDGFAWRWDAEDLSGAYEPILITISNGAIPEYIFQGIQDSSWGNSGNWETGKVPPLFYNGNIMVNSSCEVPSGYNLQLGSEVNLKISSGNTLNIK